MSSNEGHPRFSFITLEVQGYMEAAFVFCLEEVAFIIELKLNKK